MTNSLLVLVSNYFCIFFLYSRCYLFNNYLYVPLYFSLSLPDEENRVKLKELEGTDETEDVTFINASYVHVCCGSAHFGVFC